MCLCFTVRRSIGLCFRNRRLKILDLCLSCLPSFAISWHYGGRWILAFLLRGKRWEGETSGVLTLEVPALPNKLQKGRVGWHRCAQHLFGMIYGKTVLRKFLWLHPVYLLPGKKRILSWNRRRTVCSHLQLRLSWTDICSLELSMDEFLVSEGVYTNVGVFWHGFLVAYSEFTRVKWNDGFLNGSWMYLLDLFGGTIVKHHTSRGGGELSCSSWETLQRHGSSAHFEAVISAKGDHC